MITCLPLSGLLEYCQECDKVALFVQDFCFICGCHSPSGDPCDDSISREEYDARETYYLNHRVVVGDLRIADKSVQETFEKYYNINS